MNILRFIVTCHVYRPPPSLKQSWEEGLTCHKIFNLLPQLLTRFLFIFISYLGMPEALRSAGEQTFFEGHFTKKHILQQCRKSNSTCVLSSYGDYRLLPMLVERIYGQGPSCPLLSALLIISQQCIEGLGRDIKLVLQEGAFRGGCTDTALHSI